MSNISEVETDPSSVIDELWDVIVVGTGVGGATIGHRLAEEGHRVLFIEKGKANFPGPESMGVEVESSEERLASAHWPERITTRVDGRESHIFAPLGCGAGGSSVLYAATLERFERSDVESTAELPHPTGGWPVAWSEVVRYYEEAERLYRVVGTSDPLSPRPQKNLRPPPPASAVDDHFMDVFAKTGLHPYRLHVGFGYKPGCTECGGKRCERDCRSDARSVCLAPALRTGRSVLLAECEAIRFEACSQRIESVICRHEGRLYPLRGRAVVLAAGAYHSPAILLRSRSSIWPHGIANGSGLVGRNLMFHANEWFAVWPRRKLTAAGPRRTIGLRDFYVRDGMRLGMLQSTGLSAGFSEVYGYLVSWLDRSVFRRVTPLRQPLRVLAGTGSFLFGRATIFTMIIEDLPHAANRVVLDPSNPERIRVIYDIPDELRQRARRARKLLRTALGRFRTLSLQLDVQLNYGHPCGTCRFGNDPGTSVIDRNCKAHELDNLYVVDASFMPTSGGTNPSLTIAANALRVADALSKHLKETSAAVAA